MSAKVCYKWLLSLIAILLMVILTPLCRTGFAQQSVLFSWQGTINPPAVTNQVWGDHNLFQKGTGYQQFVVAINSGYGASVTATASSPIFLYIVPDEYAAPWYWVGDYYPGSDFTRGDSSYIYAASYNGTNLNVQFWAPKSDNWHFVFYNEGTSNLTVSLQATLLEPADVSLNIAPSENVTYGQPLTLSGTVAATGTPLQNGDIALMLTQGYGQDQTIANVSLQNGQYTYQWTPDAGAYTIYAQWSGNGLYPSATSQQVQVTVNKMPVTMQVDPITKVELDPIFQSPVNVQVSGRITPPLQGVQITVTYGPTHSSAQLSQNIFNPTQSFPYQSNAVTDANGLFAAQVPIDKPGSWQTTIAWDGDANHLGFSQSVVIEAEWNFMPYIITGVIATAGVLGSGVYLVRRKSAASSAETSGEGVSHGVIQTLGGQLACLTQIGEKFVGRPAAPNDMQTQLTPRTVVQSPSATAVNQVQLAGIRSNIHIAWIFELLSVIASIIGSIALLALTGLLGSFLGGFVFYLYLASGGWYLIPLFVVSLAVLMRITRMRNAIDAGNLNELMRLNTTAWDVLTLLFGGVIPGILLLMAHSSATSLFVQLSEPSTPQFHEAQGATTDLQALAQLKTLLDSNAITKEEFDQLKKRVMTSTSGPNNMESQLSTLRKLHDSGALTDTEYAQQKSRVLGENLGR